MKLSQIAAGGVRGAISHPPPPHPPESKQVFNQNNSNERTMVERRTITDPKWFSRFVNINTMYLFIYLTHYTVILKDILFANML